MEFRKAIRRPALPYLSLPVCVRSAGHYLLDEACEMPMGHQSPGFVEVFWGVSGEGDITLDGGTFRLRPGDVVWKSRDELHGYRTVAAPWDLRWFTLEGPLADDFIRGYGYARHLEGAGPCPKELFEELISGIPDIDFFAQRRLLSVATHILALAGRKLMANNQAKSIADRFAELVRDRYRDPNTNINSLAEEMRTHRSTLSRHVTEMMGLSPGEFLAQVRIQEASALLRETNLSVLEIGVEVGLPDKSQFSKLFKRKAGLSPSAYRRKAGE
jgi:AraC-like DNA-binding protein